MFSRSIARASRSPASSLAIPSICCRANVSTVGVAVSTRARRHSSSKASCPPDGTRGSEPAANSSASPTEEKRPSNRLSRRKSKDSSDKKESPEKKEAFASLPSVPSTHHLKPDDIRLSSFFSLHRPISLVQPIPQTYTTESFNSIFDQSASKHKPNDIIYTLSSAVSALGGGRQSDEERDLRWEILQQSRSKNGMSAANGSMINVDQLVKSFRPYNVPPAPVPFDMVQEDAAETKVAKERQRKEEMPEEHSLEESTHKTYQTTVVIKETTSPSGKKTFSASATPIVERRTPSKVARQPFLMRMAARQQSNSEPAEMEGEDGGMLLISVKRQRKLKMKKHKYKKLMRRTRNLRRRQGRT